MADSKSMLGSASIIFCDNEGCLVDGKDATFDLAALQILRRLLDGFGPDFFALATGRSIPYVEAVLQALGQRRARLPSVCEGGAALYFPAEDRWAPLAESVDRVRVRRALAGVPCREEPGKHVCCSLYPEHGASVSELEAAARRAGLHNDYSVNTSTAALDITPLGITKASGVLAACTHAGVSPADCLGIGDAANDLPMLRLVGLAACPANALPEVSAICHYVSEKPAVAGVIDICSRVRRR